MSKLSQQELKKINQLWANTYLRLDQMANRLGRKSPQHLRNIINKYGLVRLCKNCQKMPVPKKRTQFCCAKCKEEYWRIKRTKDYRGKINCPICGKPGYWFNRIHVPTGQKIGECVLHVKNFYSHKGYLQDLKKGKTHGGMRSKPVKTCYIPKNQWTP